MRNAEVAAEIRSVGFGGGGMGGGGGGRPDVISLGTLIQRLRDRVESQADPPLSSLI